MTYDEWLEIIKRLEKSYNKDDVEKFNSAPPNENLKELLIPKIKTMIYNRLYNSINKLTENLDVIFETEEELDLYMVSFKKSIEQTRELLKNQQLMEPDKIELYTKLRIETDKAYDILISQSDKDTEDGVLSSIIKNNRIKWSDMNELFGSQGIS